MRLGRDGIAGLIGLAVSLALLPSVLGLPKLPIVPIGPGFYPSMVLIFMAACCAILVVQDLLVPHQPVTGAEAPVERPRHAYKLVLAAFVVTGLYILLMPWLGFRIASALFVAAFQLVLERPSTFRQWLVLAAIAVGTSAVTYLVFDSYLSVLLPRGTWTNW